jgi:hypothetical protein
MASVPSAPDKANGIVGKPSSKEGNTSKLAAEHEDDIVDVEEGAEEDQEEEEDEYDEAEVDDEVRQSIRIAFVMI